MTARVYSAICSYSGILPPVNRTRLKHDCKKGCNAELSYESIALHCVLLHVRHERMVGQFISTCHYPGLLTAFKRLFVQY